VDAGTGLYALGKSLTHQSSTYHLVFSHIHWDHIQGLPFFSPLHNPSSQIIIYAPDNCIDLLQKILIGASRSTFLPNPPGEVAAQLHFITYRSGESWAIGDINIGAVELNHPCFSYGLRFDHNSSSFVYYSDTAPFNDILFGSKYLPRAPRQKPSVSETRKLLHMRKAAIELSSKTDLLIHDAHFTSEEYPRFAHFGHSTPQHALEMAIAAQVKTLILYHHSPDRKDKELEQIEAYYRSAASEYGIDLYAAREGERISI
jgi:ribonuclease BN (tRNA processing enzyme)